MFFWFLKKFNIPSTGCVPSPTDRRDILLSEIYPLPVRIAPEMPPPFDLDVLDQNGFPYCVGYAGAGMKQEKELRERRRITFDGDWLYQECKKIDGIPDEEGTYLRTVLKVLKDKGAKPKDEPEEEAAKYRIGGYARVDDLSLAGLKKAYYASGVLLLGFSVSNSGWQNAFIEPPKPGEETDGHATFMIGYNRDDGIGQNSWGNDWGDNGKFYIPNNYLPFEAWAILVDLPNDFIRIEKPKYIFNQNLEQGDRNAEVVWLQKCLKYLSMFPQIIDTTGYFGQVTLRAVQLFQTTYNIVPVSGYVGLKTRTKLNELFGS